MCNREIKISPRQELQKTVQISLLENHYFKGEKCVCFYRTYEYVIIRDITISTTENNIILYEYNMITM